MTELTANLITESMYAECDPDGTKEKAQGATF
jgi:hypothetical protein